MDKRLDTSRSGYHEQDFSSHSKKGKKRSSKRSNVFNSWTNSTQSNQNNDMVPGMEYQHILWQSGMQQNFPSNGQRLFAATSDPSVCSYTPMPMTYTMEPVSLPAMYRLYQPVPFSGIRTVHGRPKRHCNQSHPMNMSPNIHSMANGYTSLQENGSESPVPTNYQNGDYASLPSTANKNNGMNGDELNSEHRRYSDPGLGSAEPPVHSPSEDSDSVNSGSSITTIGRSNKLVLSLIEQMTELKKSNSQLFKELSETKSELENVKIKLIQCKHNSSSDYQPGMLSDLIREVREANKMCEESLVTKVKSMVEEKYNQKVAEMGKLNNQMLKLIKEREESDTRITKLEEEVATLKLNANNEGREIAAFEEETLALRRELQEARASRTLAENHAAKCVNAVARSVTPVSFETPCITSTPVRTALSDTCNLIPYVPSSSSQNFTSILRSRSAEVAHHFVPEKTNLYRNTIDCSPLKSVVESCEDPWTYDDKTNQIADASSTTQFKPAETCTNEFHDRANEYTDDGTIVDETLSFLSFEGTTKKEDKSTVNGETEHDKRNTVTPVNGNSVDNMEVNDKLTSDDLKEGDDNTSSKKNRESTQRKSIEDSMILSSLVEEKTSRRGEVRSDNPTEPTGMESPREQCVQRGSFKKSRRKKGNGSIKRSYSETDKSSKSTDQQITVRSISVNDNTSKDNVRRTVSEDEDCHDDDQTSRAITEIPEVTVVGGGSFVPKDLCSTGILTSRVLTAPSRATYTTAYI